MIKPAQAKLIAYRDRTFDATVTVKEDGVVKDLTNFTVTCQIRKNKHGSVYQGVTVAVATPANGVCVLSLTAAQMLLLDTGNWYYDLKVTSDISLESYSYLEGEFKVFDTVTRSES